MALLFPKIDKLKSRKAIDTLFTEGKSVAQFPLRLAYLPNPDGSESKFGVSVSKRYFKKAVDRNYIKRLLREIYRQNQVQLKEGLEGGFNFMLLYQSKEIMPYTDLNEKAALLFRKFRKAVAEKQG